MVILVCFPSSTESCATSLAGAEARTGSPFDFPVFGASADPRLPTPFPGRVWWGRGRREQGFLGCFASMLGSLTHALGPHPTCPPQFPERSSCPAWDLYQAVFPGF